MLRVVDVQLLVVALLAGVGASLAALVRARRTSLGATVVIGAVVTAVLVDTVAVKTLSHDAPGSAGQRLALVVVAALTAVGGTRVSADVSHAPMVELLAAVAIMGVWAGVPETSAAVLGAGVLIGLGAVATARHSQLTRGAAGIAAMLPVGAAMVGAHGDAHALVGGALCSATLVLLAVGPAVQQTSLAAGTVVLLVEGAAVAVAARHVAVARTWDGAPIRVGLVLALSLLAALLLWRRQRVPSPS